LKLGHPEHGHVDSGTVKFVLKNEMALLVFSRLVVVDPSLKIAIYFVGREVTSSGSGHIPIIGIFVPKNGS
jgi:hypothetical protein